MKCSTWRGARTAGGSIAPVVAVREEKRSRLLTKRPRLAATVNRSGKRSTKPEPETLTFGQIKFLVGFTLIGLLPLLVMVGQELRTDPKQVPLRSRPAGMVSAALPFKVVHLSSGTSGQASTSDACVVLDGAVDKEVGRWTISGSTLAGSESPGGWDVSPSGMVTLPPNAAPGTYSAEIYTDISCNVPDNPAAPGILYRSLNFTVDGLPSGGLRKLALR
jgi:hypothetical protein